MDALSFFRCRLTVAPTVLGVVSVLGMLAFPCSAATLRVPSEYPTIQAGIDTAAHGDTVLVAPGTYSGARNRDLTFHGKDLVLVSEAGAAATVIDCEWGAGRGIYFTDGETVAAVVDGFTFFHFGGEAIYLQASSATIRNCTAREGWAQSAGAKVWLWSSAIFIGCVFTENQSSVSGGGITAELWSSITVIDCTFIENATHTFQNGGAIAVLEESSAVVDGCIFLGNWAMDHGGGLYVQGRSSATVSNCTFSDNCAWHGGGIYAEGSVSVSNTIIAFGHGSGGGGALCGPGGALTFRCSDLYGNEGGDWVGCIAGQLGVDGNITVDPLFCDRHPPGIPYPCGLWGFDHGTFTIHRDSPCAPEQTGPCGLIGALPVGCGATAVEPTTWGRIKRQYQGR